MVNETVSDYGEKGLINRIILKSSDNKNYMNNIGDDCSVTNIGDEYLISTTDMLIRSSHFPKQMSYFDMGFKAVTVNVSDLASMGGNPLGFLLNMAIPKDLNIDYFDDIINGAVSACRYYNIPLIGGDTNHYDEIIISGTALGMTNKEPMMKYGFSKGDLVCLTGKIGLASLGFYLLNENTDKTKSIIEKINSLKIDEIYKCENIRELAVFKALKPEARIKSGKLLLDNNVKVATDITDGLGSEFESILSADKKYLNHNGVSDYNKGIRIYEDKIPVSDEYINIINQFNLDLYEYLFHIGEDFELLFVIPRSEFEDLKNKLDFYVIGEVTDSNTVEIQLRNGEIRKLSDKGYNHFEK